MMIEIALRDALGMAIEDSTGPWELLWDLRQRFPTGDDRALTLIASLALYQLAVRNQIRIIRWNPELNTEKEITTTELLSILMLSDTWAADRPGNVSHIRFYATAVGQDVYNASAIQV
jgi:hypothetical protein